MPACVRQWKISEFLRRGFPRSWKQLNGYFRGVLWAAYSSNGTISGHGNHSRWCAFWWVLVGNVRFGQLGAISTRKTDYTAYDVTVAQLKTSSLKIQDAKMTQKIAICAPSHRFVGLYLRNQGMYRQSEKNLLNGNMSSICPHNILNFGLLTTESLGYPSKFQLVSRLAALL